MTSEIVIADGLKIIIWSSLPRTNFELIGNPWGYFPIGVGFEHSSGSSLSNRCFSTSRMHMNNTKSHPTEKCASSPVSNSLRVMLLVASFFSIAPNRESHLVLAERKTQHCCIRHSALLLAPTTVSSLGCLIRALERRSIEHS
jgi:hypothetical protein